MSLAEDIDVRVRRFGEWYGDSDSCPTANQWREIFARQPEKPLTLINFFKFRDVAKYPGVSQSGADRVSGSDAFGRYAAASIPAAQDAGVRFLHVGPVDGVMLGHDESWDLVAIGAYPNLDAFIRLYSDDSYRAAFHHRSAACEQQRVLVCSDD